jgi:hypothetical protein
MHIALGLLLMFAKRGVFTALFYTGTGRWVLTIQIVDGRGITHRHPTPTHNRRIVFPKVVGMWFIRHNPKHKILFQQLPLFDAMAVGFIVFINDAIMVQRNEGIELSAEI